MSSTINSLTITRSFTLHGHGNIDPSKGKQDGEGKSQKETDMIGLQQKN